MITILQAIIMGLIQGVTELFPISSLGHSVIIPSLFNWNLHQNQQWFLTFLVATHAATALVLFFFFWKDWMKVFSGLWRSLRAREIAKDDTYAKFGWMLVVATIPAGILGLLFQDSLQKLFASARFAAFFLIINGIILYGAEKLRKRANQKHENDEQVYKNISKLSWIKSVGIGVAQSLALAPGISRSGASMAGGLLSGLDNEEAAKFSFMLLTPIIAAAAVLKLPSIFSSSYDGIRTAMFLGAIAAAVAAFLSIRYLVKYFHTRTLTPFAVYCFFGGIIYSIYFLVK